MKHPLRTSLLPPLLAAGALLAASGIARAMLDAEGAWLAGPVLLAGGLLSADALGSWLRSGSWRVTGTTWVLVAALLAASGLVAWRDPALVATLLPVLGAAAATGIVLRAPTCGSRASDGAEAR